MDPRIKKTHHYGHILWVIAALVVLQSPGFCQAEDISYFDLSLDELAAEYQTVVSGSRQSQAINELSVPVKVITAEDIHASGLTSIPEILQFYTGMDVVRLDRNRYAVGVRGLHDGISERTLTLINGRNAGSPAYGGSEYSAYPVMMEDIDRIEVVLGPGGAAWGANAFTGVVNIITKAPKDVQGFNSSVTLNEYGDTYTHLRLASETDKLSWRASVGYEDKESSDQAGAGDYATTLPSPLSSFAGYPYEARDYSRDVRFDSEAVYTYSEQTSLAMGLGYARNNLGSYEVAGYLPNANAEVETVRPYARLNRTFSDQASGYLQWYANSAENNVPALRHYETLENDVEAQLNLKLHEQHDTSLGGNVRWWRIKAIDGMQDPLAVRFNDAPYDDLQTGAFAIDRWHVTSRWTLEGQARLDYYTGTETDWSARATSLYALGETQNHMLRASIARAVRTPLRVLMESSMSRVEHPFAPGTYLVNYLGNKNLNNEETWSVEAGYTGKLSNDVTLLVNGYFQRFERMIGYSMTTTLVGGIPSSMATPENLESGDSYGLEIEVEKKFAHASLSTWYGYNGFDADHEGNFRAYAPARHKAGLRGRVHVGQSWTVNGNYRYSDTTEALLGGTGKPSAKANHRLDVAIAKSFNQNHGELMIGISDILNETNGPALGLSDLSGHETPGRTAFARLQFNF